MEVSVFGLGYVGCVSAACLARDGHTVVGVDVNPQKIAQVTAGLSPIVEPGLDELVAAAVRDGALRATADGQAAIGETELSLICVGTPSNGNGSLKMDYLEHVCQEIGTALAARQDYHVVVVRSTVLPGTVRDKLIPILEQYSGRRAGTDFGVCMNPEFLREGSAIEDYYSPSYIVVGELDPRSGDAVESLYAGVNGPVIRTNVETAEVLKYVNNAFHALKVVFANEVGSLCKAHGVDARDVMDIFVRDHRLNISPAYLTPGFAFGGSCLPKDLRALVYRAKERDIETPLLEAALDSNLRQVQRGIRMVESTGYKKVGVLGLSFKAGTDDVRESPVVPLVETLVGRGYQVSIYDEKVDPERLVGANKSFLERELPHIASLMRYSVQDVVTEAEVVVVANRSAAFREVPYLIREGQVLVDLAGIVRKNGHMRGKYDGIGW